ncbi:MAG: ExbD/TolR family protein [Verrucomicrobiales bacterium]
MKLYRTKRTDFAPLIFFPMLNVALLLLAFFMLGSSFILQPGMALTLPSTTFTISPAQDVDFISIPATPGVPRIFLNDKPTTIEGLGALLDDRLEIRRSIIIRADRNARFGVVAEVADVVLQRGLSVAIAGAEAQP